jgi:hypothetical protein
LCCPAASPRCTNGESSITIGGQVIGDSQNPLAHFGIVAQWIVSLSIGGKTISLNSGPENDTLKLSPNGQVTLLEVTN